MTKLLLQNVGLEYPVYSHRGRLLREAITQLVVGGLVKRSSGTEVVVALSDINLELHPGDALGLTGHNGSGKSTLLRVMAGIYPPSTGVISRQGSVRSIIELGAGLEYELSGRENIYRLGLLQGMSFESIRDFTDEIIDFSGLGDFIDLPVRTYSAGMLTRLMFSISTAVPPEILLLDEMIGAGDEDFYEKAQQRMEGLINTSKILVLASHSTEIINKFCNRRIRLEHGTVVEDIKL